MLCTKLMARMEYTSPQLVSNAASALGFSMKNALSVWICSLCMVLKIEDLLFEFFGKVHTNCADFPKVLGVTGLDFIPVKAVFDTSSSEGLSNLGVFCVNFVKKIMCKSSLNPEKDLCTACTSKPNKKSKQSKNMDDCIEVFMLFGNWLKRRNQKLYHQVHDAQNEFIGEKFKQEFEDQ
jgi:hypothetical protein